MESVPPLPETVEGPPPLPPEQVAQSGQRRLLSRRCR
jgi:hypothetical protein